MDAILKTGGGNIIQTHILCPRAPGARLPGHPIFFAASLMHFWIWGDAPRPPIHSELCKGILEPFGQKLVPTSTLDGIAPRSKAQMVVVHQRPLTNGAYTSIPKIRSAAQHKRATSMPRSPTFKAEVNLIYDFFKSKANFKERSD